MKNKKLFLSIILACSFFAVVLISDLISKHFIFKILPNYGDSRDFINGFINIVHVENKGAAWGIMAGRPIFLIVVSLVVLALFLTFYILRAKKLKGKTSILLGICAGLISAGCLGNLIDRIAFGYVRDFINFQFMNFPVFNIADISVCVSIVLLIVYFLFIYPKEEKKDVEKDKKENLNNKEEFNEKADQNQSNVEINDDGEENEG